MWVYSLAEGGLCVSGRGDREASLNLGLGHKTVGIPLLAGEELQKARNKH